MLLLGIYRREETARWSRDKPKADASSGDSALPYSGRIVVINVT
jgi:hypothetical protein